MTFTARTAAEIRDAFLRNLRTRYLSLGRDIDISEGSDAYNEADAFALALEPSELGAREAANRVLLRYQYGADLDESAADEGTTRLPASAARRVARVLGPASSSVAVNGATLGASSGLRFAPINATTGEALTSITTDGAGYADLTVECTTAGTDGNLPLATTLTWSSAPPRSWGRSAAARSAPGTAPCSPGAWATSKRSPGSSAACTASRGRSSPPRR